MNSWLNKGMKVLAKGVLKLAYRVEVTGLEHFNQAKQSERPMLIVANHVSLLDGPLLATFLPDDITFLVDEAHTQKKHEAFFLSFVDFFSVNMHSPFATKHMIEALRTGKHCMIFPEGRITTTGSLMKVYEGTAMVADHANAQILPIYLQGPEQSRLSYLDGTRVGFLKQKWFPKVRIAILPPTEIKAPTELARKAQHAYFKNHVYLLMRDLSFWGQPQPQSVWLSLVSSIKRYGGREVCVEDIKGTALNRKKLLIGSIALGRALHAQLIGQKRVGLLLPNVAGLPVSFFALQAFGHVPAMLNFTAGLGPIRSACETAQLQTVITSHQFVEAFGLESVIEGLSDRVEFIYLEEVRETIGTSAKLAALMTMAHNLPGARMTANDEAVVLFTSGSEGAPKGVVLSQSNLLSNVDQISAMLTLLPGDQMFNALPTFHSFGLTAGLLWPVLKGLNVFLYPSPLHYAEIPERVYQLNAKLMFGTDTFFTGYAKKAHPFDFFSVKYMVAGAERLRPETRQLYSEKFHLPIFEGYGVTETSPVLAVNSPLSAKLGSVGQFVPGVEYRLEPVEGISQGGRLWVKGPNIMLGYLLSNAPGVLQPPKDGWHDTGDIVDVDEEGFVFIKGRAKRFAKIGGEMISLTAVETYINQASPEGHHVVVAVADARKGEQLILVTNDDSLSRQTVKQAAQAAQVAEIMIPKIVILVETIPVLGTGKTNYPEVQKIAERHFEV